MKSLGDYVWLLGLEKENLPANLPVARVKTIRALPHLGKTLETPQINPVAVHRIKNVR